MAKCIFKSECGKSCEIIELKCENLFVDPIFNNIFMEGAVVINVLTKHGWIETH